jgi:xanthine dehydrogenase YagR molybdenum-binding subunit
MMSHESLGADAQRIDGADKVTGKPLYGADRLLPRMAYALPLIATIGKGRIQRMDTSKAEAAANVLLVLTHRNADRLRPLQFIFAGGHGTQSFQPLQSDAILYRGQAIALVVANTVEAAQAAAHLIEVEYQSAPFAVTLDGDRGEVVVQSVAAPFFEDLSVGNADEALATAAVRVDASYSTPVQHHNAMELLSTVVEWQANRLIVHESTQNAQGIREGLALQLGLEPGNVRVMSPSAGGGFGARNALAPHTVLAAMAARRVGRPVKLVLPRDQGYYDIHFRPAAKQRIRLGADRSGRFIAAIHEARVQTSRFDVMPYLAAETTARAYAFPNFRSATTLVRLDTQTPGFMRPPFEMSGFFALESAIDELACELARDPVELRLANDTQVDPITGEPFSLRRLSDCLRRGAQRFGWERRSARPASMRDTDGTLVGWGVACGVYPGYTAPVVATVQLQTDGTAAVQVGGHEMGQGIRTAIALTAATELGLDPQQIDITIGDTIAPPQHPTAGSWGAVSACPAVQEAARQVRTQLTELAASDPDSPLRGLTPAAITLRNGKLHGANVDGLPFADLLKRRNAPLTGRGQWFAPGQTPEVLARAEQGLVAIGGPVFNDFVVFSHAAHFAEVRIDPRIPRPRVSRMVSVIDCGKVISRRTASSQVYGGIVWGIGAALSEQTEVDARFGGFLNTDIAEYQVAVQADIGECEVDFIDEPDPKLNPLGAKGLGEIATVGAAAAIANAVYHATGRRVRDLPIRIENLL